VSCAQPAHAVITTISAMPSGFVSHLVIVVLSPPVAKKNRLLFRRSGSVGGYAGETILPLSID
jgi:hypothetical protein